MANVFPFRHTRRRHLPPIWAPYLRQRGWSAAQLRLTIWTGHLRHRRWSAAQLRLTVWTGMLLGLLAYQATRLAAPPEHLIHATPPTPPTVEARDPYDEARRSRANLEAQEGAPAH